METSYYSVTEAGDGSNYVQKSGDTMTGNLDMDQNRVTNPLEPQGNMEVANTSYVDNAISESANPPHHFNPFTYLMESVNKSISESRITVVGIETFANSLQSLNKNEYKVKFFSTARFSDVYSSQLGFNI